jgi:hypothetical protein
LRFPDRGNCSGSGSGSKIEVEAAGTDGLPGAAKVSPQKGQEMNWPESPGSHVMPWWHLGQRVFGSGMATATGTMVAIGGVAGSFGGVGGGETVARNSGISSPRTVLLTG